MNALTLNVIDFAPVKMTPESYAALAALTKYRLAKQADERTHQRYQEIMADCPYVLPLDCRAEDAEYEEFCIFEQAAGVASGWYDAQTALHWAEEGLLDWFGSYATSQREGQEVINRFRNVRSERQKGIDLAVKWAAKAAS